MQIFANGKRRFDSFMEFYAIHLKYQGVKTICWVYFIANKIIKSKFLPGERRGGEVPPLLYIFHWTFVVSFCSDESNFDCTVSWLRLDICGMYARRYALVSGCTETKE